MDLNLPAPPTAKNNVDNTEIIYSLPKTYNGKTVNDLFPEFRSDAVLRFSKLFGLGRATSLPKIWKGSRKRKKQKSELKENNENVQKENNQPLANQPANQDLDVFKMLDDALLTDVEKPSEQNMTAEAKEASKENDDATKTNESKPESPKVQDKIEYEVDDEVELMKPFRILEETSDSVSSEQNLGLSSDKKKDPDSTWRYGPASYWYDLTEPDQYIIKQKEKSPNKKAITNKNKDEESTTSDYEMKDLEKDESKKPIETVNPDTETIDLSQSIKKLNSVIEDEKCLLVSTMNWENNILIELNHDQTTNGNVSNGEKQVAFNQSTEIINERIKYAGWIPSTEHRTLFSYQSKIFGKKVDFLDTYKDQSVPSSTTTSSKQSVQTVQSAPVWNSIFPNENYDLFLGEWEKKIILDPENIDSCLFKPPEFFIDPNDDNLLLGVPDDPSNNLCDDNAANTAQIASTAKGKDVDPESKKDKSKIYENRTKISKSLLGRTGVIKDDQNNDTENDSAHKSQAGTNSHDTKSFWNISNDEYYNPKTIGDQTTVSKNVPTSLVLQHTLVALELRALYFPTYMNTLKLRNFHRYPLKRFLSGVLLNEPQFFPISSLLRRACLNKKSEKSITIFPATTSTVSVGSDFNLIQNASDLSCTDNCEIVLAEYSEQFPPLMMQVGMATKIRNYYKRKFAKDDGPQNLEFGELVYANNSPFLGALKPGDFLQSVENYMFRAPIYMHKMPEQDFLLIRSRNMGYTVRGDFKNLFVVGQECPLIEVPGPNSKRANSFLKDFLQVHILRMFHRSREFPKRIKMEDVKKAFPTHPESAIRKRLKLISDLRPSDAHWWVLKEEVRLPTEEEIRSIMTPEQCCAYYSMCAAEQRLKDAGYGEKNLFASDDDDVDNIKIDDEVKNAPWHTTRAYIDAIKGKCLLQINGVADPTGRGEGFSYVRQPFKPSKQEEETEKAEKAQKSEDLAAASPQPAATAKRTVTGTDADLRRLHLSQAKELLASYGVPDHEIKKLKRWEIIDVVRTMSTQKAKEGNGSAVSKFARGNRYSQSDAHEKFREECQNLFDMQNRNLASAEFLSTDDDEDLDEDSDVDEMGKNLESMLQTNKKTETEAAKPSNESAKVSSKPMDKSTELKNLIMSKTTVESTFDSKSKNEPQVVPPNMHRILKITRTYKDEETGQELTKVEIIKKPLIIDAYVKIRSTKDDEFIRTAFALDETEKENLRKERRRLQEQLRRVKRNEAKRANSPNGIPKTRKYNKSGAVRKYKKSKLAGDGEAATPNMKKNKSLLYSSADDDKSMSFATNGEMQGDQSQSNMMDTTASSLNNTLTGQVGVVKKRKYQKRKKLDINASSTPGNVETSATGLSKVEGTKLIIQKKAIKLAMNNGEQFGGDADTPGVKVKKPRMSKKFLKNQLSNLMVVENTSETAANEADQSGENLQAPKLKLKIQKKNPSLILHIPKDKLGTSFNQSAQGDNSALDYSAATNTSITESPTKKAGTPGQPKRTYNKQNSLLKKQQKLMMQQQRDVQQQLEHQLKIQMTQAQFAGGSNQEQFAAAVAAASQFANLFEMQQMLALQQQISQNSPGTPNIPSTSGSQGKKSTQQQPHSSSNQSEQQAPVKRKPSTQSSQQLDYLIKPHMKKADRRHADPLVSLALILENILNELRDSPDAQPFVLPVNSKKVPDYYNLVKNPIDLQTIRKRINEKMYKNRSSFLDDIQLLVENSALYNGSNHTITASAENLFVMCEQKLSEKRDKLIRLEKAINPLLDDNFQNALNYLLDQIFEQNIMMVDNAFAFLKPVNKAKYKDYYDIIKNPIDLETIKFKIKSQKYKSREEFISDFELLYNNCITYNGLNNSYTNTAQNLLNTCKRSCNVDYKEQLQQLEDMANQPDNNEESNSQSGYIPGIVTENESNLVSNENDYDSKSFNLPTPMLSLTKKLKSLNKKISINQNFNRPEMNSMPKSSGGSKPCTSASAISSKQRSLPQISRHKDSPKSGSDADVFVDVESIDERGYSLMKQKQENEDNDTMEIGNEYYEDY